MKFIILYITHTNAEEAQKVVDHLLQHKLIACANMFPIQACYLWKGNIERGEEVVTLLKTKIDYWEKVKTKIEKIHPYETPCIIKIEVEGSEKYMAWLESEVV